MKVCVLLPDYSTTAVDYQYYDPPRNLSTLLPGDEVDHVFLNKLTTFKQLKELSRKGYAIFVNLCEGYLEWEVPSIDVIYTLELLQLPFTGPTSRLYDPPKELMKYVAYCAAVLTPGYTLVQSAQDLTAITDHLQFPLFVKPAKAGDSLGVDDHSLVHTMDALQRKVESLLPEYPELLVEEYIAGREFTVLVAAGADGSVKAYRPVEYIFPEGFAFKTYALKTAELHPGANIPCTDPQLDEALRAAAIAIFRGFDGKGYARLDFRLDAQGRLYFLEINFTCSVFYTDGYEGSADYILRFDGTGPADFLQRIIGEGLARYAQQKKKYLMRGNALAGFGIYATRTLQKGESIFTGEGRSQRLVTKRFVETHWTEQEKEVFRRYAYPLSDELFVLWDQDPAEWAPQNHSCDPNTAYDGLNVIAIRTIAAGEELTLDYAAFLDEHMEPFPCRCGSSSCRGTIRGIPGNSVTFRENQRRG
jgi:hypothetical protein